MKDQVPNKHHTASVLLTSSVVAAYVAHNSVPRSWYDELFLSDRWRLSFFNCIYAASSSTIAATVLGTMAALGMSGRSFPFATPWSA